MTLTVTAGDSASDSYAAVDDATTYATAHGLAFTGDTADQEAALRRATAWVDATYRGQFSGVRVNGRSQSLEWPRKNAYDVSGELIGSTTIPREIVDATIEAAARELAAPSSLSPDVVPGQAKTLIGVGEISWQASPSGFGADAQKPIVAAIDGILGSILAAKTGTLLRA